MPIQERTYKMKGKSSRYKDAKKPAEEKQRKRYTYSARFIFGVNIEDLVELVGAEAACKLIHLYGGANMYIPKVTSIRRRVQDVAMRAEFKQLIDEGCPRNNAEAHLAKRYSMSIQTIRVKTGRYGMYHHEKQVQFPKDFLLRCAADQKLVDLIARHRSLFRKYKIV